MSQGILILTLALCPSRATGADAGPRAVQARDLDSPAADPFVSFVSVGPAYEFDPVYRVLEPGACSTMVNRALILSYSTYSSIVVEEIAFAGARCQDMKVLKSLSINGVTLGYALGEGPQFARDLVFAGWEAHDAFLIRSVGRHVRIRINTDQTITAEPAGSPPVLPAGER